METTILVFCILIFLLLLVIAFSIGCLFDEIKIKNNTKEFKETRGLTPGTTFDIYKPFMVPLSDDEMISIAEWYNTAKRGEKIDMVERDVKLYEKIYKYILAEKK